MTIETANEIGRAIIGAAAIIGAIYAIIVNSSKFKNWMKMKRKRQEKLDELINCSDGWKTSSAQLEVLSHQMTTLAQTVEALAATQNQTIKHNQRQDAEIEQSRDQRKSLTFGLFAILDGLKQQGANGIVTKAHKKLREEMINQAHQPFSVDKEKEKGKDNNDN